MRANFDAITQDFYNLVDRILVIKSNRQILGFGSTKQNILQLINISPTDLTTQLTKPCHSLQQISLAQVATSLAQVAAHLATLSCLSSVHKTCTLDNRSKSKHLPVSCELLYLKEYRLV